MDEWPKEKLITQITHLEEQLKYYQKKLQDLVAAYKGLVKEREALKSSVKALENVKNDREIKKNNSSSNLKETEHSSEIPSDKFYDEVITLRNSLATLSAEKCRIETLFHADKKLLRQEKQLNEIKIEELQNSLKKLKNESAGEIERSKSQLIIQKYEKEKLQKEYASKTKELHQLLVQERREKKFVEKSLSQKHCLTSEIEEKQLHEMEQISREQIAVHERRVANLETRLMELSDTIANYHKYRQQDQNEIWKLKDYITELNEKQKKFVSNVDEEDIQIPSKENEANVNSDYIGTLVNKLLMLKTHIINVNKQLENPVDIHILLCDQSHKNEMETVSLDVHRQLMKEYESLLHKFTQITQNCNETENLKISTQFLLDKNSELNKQLEDTITKYESHLEGLQKEMQSVILNDEMEKKSIHSYYKLQISDIKNQMQRQRDRTLTLLDEKEQEIFTLKSSFKMFLPGNENATKNTVDLKSLAKHVPINSILNDNLTFNNGENPHILHYAHELARKDINLTNFRKIYNQLEQSLHETNKELILTKEKHFEEITSLKAEIARLERCQAREGANLEYLKNIIVNYLLSQNQSTKRHMLNAIAAVLKFSDSELQSIKKCFN